MSHWFSRLALCVATYSFCSVSGAAIIYDIVAQCSSGCVGTANTTISLFDTYQPGTVATPDDVIGYTYSSSSGSVTSNERPLQPITINPIVGIFPLSSSSSVDLRIDYIGGGTYNFLSSDGTWISQVIGFLSNTDQGNAYTVTRRAPTLFLEQKKIQITDVIWFNPADNSTYNPHFNLSAGGGDVTVSLDLKLNGTVPSLLKEQWEMGIEKAWNDKYVVVDGSQRYKLAFDVNFVDSGEDFSIRVIDGPGRPDALNWYTEIASEKYTQDYQPLIAAHEFGHLVGLPDEYCESVTELLEKLVSPFCTFTGTGFVNSVHNIMSEIDKDPARHHFDRIIDALQIEFGRTFTVDISPDFIPNVIAFGLAPIGPEAISDLENPAILIGPASVPEPVSVVLIALGLIAVGAVRRRSSHFSALKLSGDT